MTYKITVVPEVRDFIASLDDKSTRIVRTNLKKLEHPHPGEGNFRVAGCVGRPCGPWIPIKIMIKIKMEISGMRDACCGMREIVRIVTVPRP